ncbi:helix-turn-helix domain-containing protein [Nocardia sp. ET3-3]|uniref:Helix-turn-helix domain-containing protein n=1 Tax=Nocardia terrae TaxID=2675851 RepID=A0A7K1UR23_9NOCA|nr:helix-turn-helix transcriptional regulator [Nocardia terrae]MVU76800.1 helix-turn-helix domain-containing protein [Nocardia terrae]
MPDTDAKPAVAPLPAVLGALQDPVRLEVVRRLANAGTPMRCGLTYEGISKSTAAHHFKILREAGVTEKVTIDGNTHLRLRTEELNAALPGLFDAILTAANDAANSATPTDDETHMPQRFVSNDQFAATSRSTPHVTPEEFRHDQDAAH